MSRGHRLRMLLWHGRRARVGLYTVHQSLCREEPFRGCSGFLRMVAVVCGVQVDVLRLCGCRWISLKYIFLFLSGKITEIINNRIMSIQIMPLQSLIMIKTAHGIACSRSEKSSDFYYLGLLSRNKTDDGSLSHGPPSLLMVQPFHRRRCRYSYRQSCLRCTRKHNYSSTPFAGRVCGCTGGGSPE